MIRRVNKKAQEEMVGFALIIIIVAVVGLILFGLALRGNSNSESKVNYEINQFLDSAMKVSTDCTIRNNLDYASVSDLIKECYQNSNRMCGESEINVCVELNNSLKNVVGKGLMIGANRPNKGYLINISFEGSSVGSNERLLELKEGECKGDFNAGEYIIPQSKKTGILVARLTLCK